MARVKQVKTYPDDWVAYRVNNLHFAVNLVSMKIVPICEACMKSSVGLGAPRWSKDSFLACHCDAMIRFPQSSNLGSGEFVGYMEEKLTALGLDPLTAFLEVSKIVPALRHKVNTQKAALVKQEALRRRRAEARRKDDW